ncbi:MAG: 5-oxoprolinase subunit PxpA [Bacteroidota bacterium]
MQEIDINCDMGESTALWPYHIDTDLALLPYISSINIACGAHAGDASTMHELVKVALRAGLAIGAHPGFEDRQHFGRAAIQASPIKIYDSVICQLGALDGFLKINGAKLHHVKPHGALYNMAAADEVLATVICKAIKDYDAGLVLYGLSGSLLVQAATAAGLGSGNEVFADRTYREDGSLTPRWEPGALIETTEQSLQQVMQMALHGTVIATSGKTIPVTADTICIHGDGVQALAFAKNIYQSLQQQGLVIKPV